MKPEELALSLALRALRFTKCVLLRIRSTNGTLHFVTSRLASRLASSKLRLASRHFASLRSAGATETVMASLV